MARTTTRTVTKTGQKPQRRPRQRPRRRRRHTPHQRGQRRCKEDGDEDRNEGGHSDEDGDGYRDRDGNNGGEGDGEEERRRNGLSVKTAKAKKIGRLPNARKSEKVTNTEKTNKMAKTQKGRARECESVLTTCSKELSATQLHQAIHERQKEFTWYYRVSFHLRADNRSRFSVGVPVSCGGCCDLGWYLVMGFPALT